MAGRCVVVSWVGWLTNRGKNYQKNLAREKNGSRSAGPLRNKTRKDKDVTEGCVKFAIVILLRPLFCIFVLIFHLRTSGKNILEEVGREGKQEPQHCIQ